MHKDWKLVLEELIDAPHFLYELKDETVQVLYELFHEEYIARCEGLGGDDMINIETETYLTESDLDEFL